MSRKWYYNVRAYIIALLLIVIVTGCDGMRKEEPLKICFIRGGSVWVMDENGNNERQLTYSDTDDDPSWSSDGKYIVFTREIDGYKEIYLIDADGKKENRLTYTQEDENYFPPAWLPDGNGIVYAKRYSDTYYIGVMDKNGTKLKEFVASGVNAYTIAMTVSSDSSKAYYIWGVNNTIGVINLITGANEPNPFNITNCYSVTYSPQEKAIAYVEGNNTNSIHFYNIESSETTDYILPYNLSWNNSISFSPSGDRIVFIYDLNIYVYNVQSKQTNVIATNAERPCFMGKPR